jgi:hypothetical protein
MRTDQASAAVPAAGDLVRILRCAVTARHGSWCPPPRLTPRSTTRSSLCSDDAHCAPHTPARDAGARVCAAAVCRRRKVVSDVVGTSWRAARGAAGAGGTTHGQQRLPAGHHGRCVAGVRQGGGTSHTSGTPGAAALTPVASDSSPPPPLARPAPRRAQPADGHLRDGGGHRHHRAIVRGGAAVPDVLPGDGLRRHDAKGDGGAVQKHEARACAWEREGRGGWAAACDCAAAGLCSRRLLALGAAAGRAWRTIPGTLNHPNAAGPQPPTTRRHRRRSRAAGQSPCTSSPRRRRPCRGRLRRSRSSSRWCPARRRSPSTRRTTRRVRACDRGVVFVRVRANGGKEVRGASQGVVLPYALSTRCAALPPPLPCPPPLPLPQTCPSRACPRTTSTPCALGCTSTRSSASASRSSACGRTRRSTCP